MEAPTFRFFHDQLPDDRKRAIYDAVEGGVRERRCEIVCPRIMDCSQLDYKHLLEHVYDDHPEFFSFFPILSTVIEEGCLIRVRPFYRYSAVTQAEYEAALEKEIIRILGQCFPEGWQTVSELRREKIIFDWITRNVVYDHRSYGYAENGQLEEAARSVAWNAYGALVCREAVCEGIACAFKLLCDRVGLPSLVVLGRGNTERHAWNIVRVNKKFYHVDCTWDLHSSIAVHIPYARYRYFNLPDKIIGVNHTAESSFLPVCGSLQYNPFRIRKLCASDPAELERIAVHVADQGNDRFAVMTLGFPAKQYAREVAAMLAKHVNCDVEYFSDESGYFLGFVIERGDDKRQ